MQYMLKTKHAANGESLWLFFYFQETENSVPSRDWGKDVLDMIRSANLNSSQESAISSCLETRNIRDKTCVKLIWGPPGTGKTKTVATLLFALLNLGCKSVVCAPTNTAVVEVASRLLVLTCCLRDPLRLNILLTVWGILS